MSNAALSVVVNDGATVPSENELSQLVPVSLATQQEVTERAAVVAYFQTLNECAERGARKGKQIASTVLTARMPKVTKDDPESAQRFHDWAMAFKR